MPKRVREVQESELKMGRERECARYMDRKSVCMRKKEREN